MKIASTTTVRPMRKTRGEVSKKEEKIIMNMMRVKMMVERGILRRSNSEHLNILLWLDLNPTLLASNSLCCVQRGFKEAACREGDGLCNF